MANGVMGCLVWRLGFRFNFPGLKDIHEIIPAFILSLLAYMIISKMTQKAVPDGEHLDTVFGTR
jgi:Na+/proline symporter